MLDFPKLDGFDGDDKSKCSIYWKGLVVNEQDNNCCFKFRVKQIEQILCETSNWCIFRARKLLKTAKNGCEMSGGSGDDGQVVLPNMDPIITDFAKNTGNFGYGIWIPAQANSEGDTTADGGAGAGASAEDMAAAMANGVLPVPPPALTEDQLKSARNIQVKDPWMSADPDAGLWKGTVY